MSDEYLKMLLDLSNEFFAGWIWEAGDKVYAKNWEMTFLVDRINPMGVYATKLNSLAPTVTINPDVPINENIRPIPTQKQLLKIYQEKHDLMFESLSLLWLANWLEDKVTEDHGFCLEHESADEIALMWVQETCFNMSWDGEKWRNIEGKHE